MPKEFMRMLVSLDKAADIDDGSIALQYKLETPGCSDKVMLLKEVATKAFLTLQEGSYTFECTFESLQREVKEVNDALRGALRLAVQNGADEGLMVHIFKAVHLPDVAWYAAAEALYEKAHEGFMYQVIESVEAIHDAAARALGLQDRAINIGAPWHHGGARTETQVCLPTRLAIR